MAKARRILALVLTLATVFTLFAGVTAFATEETAATTTEAPAAYDPAALVSFPDIGEANVNYDLALQFFAKVGLLQGTDGQMQPIASMTRAQAAAIIARLMLGVDAADAQPQVSTGFVDVTASEAWASGYIKYVTNAGLMKGTYVSPDGVGNTFAPNATMTIAEWEIVMLRIAGYGQANEFTGEDWAYNANYWAKTRPLSNAVSTGSAYAGVTGKTAVVYEDYMASITREQAYAFIWNLLWNVNEVSYQYGTYREVAGTMAGGNTSGKLVAETLGFGRGWLVDDEGFGDIVGEVYAYAKVAANKYAAKNWALPRGATTGTVDNFGKAKAVLTTDLTDAVAGNRIYEVVFPIGPSTEQVRTAIRNLGGTVANNWYDSQVFINGSALGVNTASVGNNSGQTFAAYLEAMSDRAPAFGYESEVRVWAVPDIFDPTATRTPLRTTVKLPALAQIGELVKDDLYTHLVNEAGLELDVLYSDPSDPQFNSREDGGDSISAFLKQDFVWSKVYPTLSAAPEGTYVSAYLMGISLRNGTLNWPTGGTVNALTADIVTVETNTVSSKRTGYLTLEEDVGEVREATWLVGNSPVLDGSNYTFYRDRYGSVLGTNIQFVGNNPFNGILYIKDADNGSAGAGDATKTLGNNDIDETLAITAALLGENTEYGVNSATTVQFTIDNSRAISSWLSGTSNASDSNAINARVEVGDRMSTLVGRFFKYTYNMTNGEPTFRLQYLNPTQFAKGNPSSLPNAELKTAATNLRSVTYLWTEGYNYATASTNTVPDDVYGRYVRTFTEKAPKTAGEADGAVYVMDGSDDYAATAAIYKLTNTTVTDVGLVDPYEVAAPREFAFFTGKMRYTASSNEFDYATFLMDGQFIERKVPKYALDSNGSDNHVGFYSIVDTFGVDPIEPYRLHAADEDEVPFTIGFNNGTSDDAHEKADQYSLRVRNMSSSVAGAIGDIFPWSLHSLWRDVIENISGEYTAPLNSEKALAINVELADTDGIGAISVGALTSVTSEIYDESLVTQTWIIPDRYYEASDLTRLGLTTGNAPGNQAPASTVAISNAHLVSLLEDAAEATAAVHLSVPATGSRVNDITDEMVTLFASMPSGSTITVNKDLDMSDALIIPAGVTYKTTVAETFGSDVTVNGTLQLAENTTVTGALAVSGTLTAEKNLTASSTSALTNGGTITAGGILTLTGVATLTEGTIDADGLLTITATSTISGTTLNANAGLSAGNTLTLAATSTLNLAGTVTFTGALTDTGGRVNVGATADVEFKAAPVLTGTWDFKDGASILVTGAIAADFSGATVTGLTTLFDTLNAFETALATTNGSIKLLANQAVGVFGLADGTVASVKTWVDSLTSTTSTLTGTLTSITVTKLASVGTAGATTATPTVVNDGSHLVSLTLTGIEKTA